MVRIAERERSGRLDPRIMQWIMQDMAEKYLRGEGREDELAKEIARGREEYRRRIKEGAEEYRKRMQEGREEYRKRQSIPLGRQSLRRKKLQEQ